MGKYKSSKRRKRDSRSRNRNRKRKHKTDRIASSRSESSSFYSSSDESEKLSIKSSSLSSRRQKKKRDGKKSHKTERSLSESSAKTIVQGEEQKIGEVPEEEPETRVANVNSTALQLRPRVEEQENLALGIYTKFRRVNFNEIPNVHRKLVIYNLPDVNEDEILQYFLTILNTLTHNVKITNPIVQMEKRDDGFYYILELATQDHLEILRNMDQTEWRNFRIRIQRPRNFFRDYNDTMGKNVIPKETNKNIGSFYDTDNKLYMSGIPTTAKEKDIREIVESFGQLKTFNLVKDPSNDELNRGFCFFEYVSDVATERALKGLNNLEMGDKKLRVQRATQSNKSYTILEELKKNPVVVTREPGVSNFTSATEESQTVPEIYIPFHASIPSRVIQFLNIITPEDVMDDSDYREITEDIRNECMNFGTVLNVEIPRPDKQTNLCGPAVGKIFVKFSTLQSSKKARKALSGRKYNRRFVIASFYPENYFDMREFNFQGERF